MGNLLDIILCTEVIAGIIIAASMAMSVRSILFFTGQASSMAPRLQRIEANLSRLREDMAEKKKAVKDLTMVVDPLKEREARLRAYYDTLKNVELEHDRRAAQNSDREEEERQRRMKRKKMGL